LNHSDLKVLYEDNHLIAIFKPAGLLSQGDKTGDVSALEVTKSWLKEKHKKPGQVFLGLVHRLDRPVCGVLLLAKTSKAASRLSEQFRTRKVKKIYHALVEGDLQVKDGELSHFIDWDSSVKPFISKEPSVGKRAELEFRTLGRFDGNTFVEIELKTGRKHQIRLQFSHLGHPLVGDFRYGSIAPEGTPLALVCQRLEFAHPTRPGDRVAIELPDSCYPFAKVGR